jgi:hypothetical protein
MHYSIRSSPAAVPQGRANARLRGFPSLACRHAPDTAPAQICPARLARAARSRCCRG